MKRSLQERSPCILQNQRTSAVILAAMLAAVLFQGCATRASRAKRLAQCMLDPGVSNCERLLCRRELMDLAPESHPFLSEAFFPIGLYDVPESSLPEVAAAGFNLVVNGGKDYRYLAKAEAAGIKVIPYINHERMAEEVERVRGRRAILAWYLMDEPDLNRLAPEAYSRLAAELRKLDETRPIYLTVWSPARYEDYVAAGDILAPNPYPIIHQEPERNNLRTVGMVLDMAREQAGNRPVWAVVQAFLAEPTWPRKPTPEELRAMAFLAINHGADGIIYFSYKSGGHPITEDAGLFGEMKRINAQLNALHGALLARPIQRVGRVDVETEARPLGLAMRTLGEASMPVDCSAREFRGAKLLIVVNPDPWGKTVAIRLPGFLAGTQAAELFAEDQSKPIKLQRDSPLSLRFDRFQVRLFWIE